MTEWSGGKRTYRAADPVEVAGGYGVELDGTPARTPGGGELVVPSRRLAQAMAAEWAAQEENIKAASMPLSCMAATALDRVGPRRHEMERVAVMFGVTDLLCYRAERPDELVAREAREWQPILDWAAEWLGGPLAVTTGVVPVNQSQAILDGLGAAIGALDDFSLAATSAVAAAAKSLIIALALHRGRIDAVQAADLALLDERFQMESWGEDGDARARLERVAKDIQEAERFLLLLAAATRSDSVSD